LQLLHVAWIQKQLACSTKMEWHSVATSATRSATNIFDVASLQL
jgi:exopolyphosphatase/pppGpp-phosphohydrolase